MNKVPTFLHATVAYRRAQFSLVSRLAFKVGSYREDLLSALSEACDITRPFQLV